MNKFLIICLFPSLFNLTTLSDAPGASQKKKGETEWILNQLIKNPPAGLRISGSPELTASKYGNAVIFDGVRDGLFLETMPLEGLDEFTLEAIIYPYSGGNTEQRFFHCGEIQGNRVLMELRSTERGWYFDAFVKSQDQNKTLVDPALIHPSNQWYHVAFVISPGKQETYVNGIKELESQIKIYQFHGGKTSLGVRLNEQSWFKGAIYKIRIVPKALTPDKFLNF